MSCPSTPGIESREKASRSLFKKRGHTMFSVCHTMISSWTPTGKRRHTATNGSFCLQSCWTLTSRSSGTLSEHRSRWSIPAQRKLWMRDRSIFICDIPSVATVCIVYLTSLAQPGSRLNAHKLSDPTSVATENPNSCYFNSRESRWKILTLQTHFCDYFQRYVCGGGELQRLYSWSQHNIGV